MENESKTNAETQLNKDILKTKKVSSTKAGQVVKPKGFARLRKLISSEDVAQIKTYVIWDVIVPHAKRIITEGIDAVLYKGKSSVGSSTHIYGNNTPYRSISAAKTYTTTYTSRHDKPVTSTRYSGGKRVDDFLVADRDTAMEALGIVSEILEEYQVISVARFKSIIKLDPSLITWTDSNYGWTSIEGADVIPVPEGCIIRMPKAIVI